MTSGESPGADDGKKLRDFFLLLAENAEKPLYQKYFNDPRGVMKEHGLSEPVVEAVMHGNLKELNRLVKGSGTDIICGTIVRI